MANSADERGVMKHDCNRYGCYLKYTHPPLHLYTDAFPGKIRPSDVDFMVERRGHFLVLEFKHGNYVPTGQRRMLETLAFNINFTVLIVFSEALADAETDFEFSHGMLNQVQLLMPQGNGSCRYIERNVVSGKHESFARWCSEWYRYANGDIPESKMISEFKTGSWGN